MNKTKIMKLRTYPGREHATSYLELRDHPHESAFGLVKRTVNLHELIDGFVGPRLTLGFDQYDRPVGIEIIYPSEDDDFGDEPCTSE
jgi:hypothetical protein